MKNITIILPIHKIDEPYGEMLLNSVNSIQDFHNDVKLMIVSPSNLKDSIQKLNLGQKLEIEYLTNDNESDFCSQINLGIKNCSTEWFSILEVDDEFKPVWLKSMNDYLKIYPDVDVFLPIVKDINTEGKFISFTNESAWAYGFSERQGFIDNEVLLDFQNYQISGGLYRTKVINDNGSLKNNIQLTFGYEFLLRLTHNGVLVLVVPKVGYQHTNFREDSLFWNFKNNDETKMKEDEVKFWLDTAKKEFFFKNKREVNYVTT
jgi:hypothetical protein